MGIRSKQVLKMKFIGNYYSGYWFPENLIDSCGTVWGVGLGFDSSFELELGKHGFEVFGFEPDLKAYSHATQEFRSTSSLIFPWGLWDKDGVFESFGSSISIVNVFENETGNHDSLEIRNIHETAKELGLENQKVPRILKLNIEGAEREILLGLASKSLPFEVIIFQAEFLLHLGFLKLRKKWRASRDLRRILEGLRLNGYLLVHIQRNQFTLVRN